MKRLEQLLEQYNLHLPSEFLPRVSHYKMLLSKWNKIHNLTGAKNDDQIDEFIFDAIYPITFLPPVTTAMDIGTGAGFPGMILAFGMENTHFTLVEPLAKRFSFLQFVKADLELPNVEVKGVRVEQLESKPYELITSRAVTDTNMLLELSQPFRDEKSLLLFYKGEKVFDEVDPSLNHQIIQTDNRHYLLIKP